MFRLNAAYTGFPRQHQINKADNKMALRLYNKKRDFRQTPEPRGEFSKADHHRFVVQEHHASNLHFDFRLEMGGVLKSWAVRKGPSLDPTVKRLAVTTEDHPIRYLKFQGTIPEGNYGAGEQLIWDTGTYELLSEGDDALASFETGKLKFRLNGEKLHGEFNLIRLANQEGQWLLIKGNDEYAEPDWRLELLLPDEEGNRVIVEDKKPEKKAAGKSKVKKTSAKTEKSSKPWSARRAFSSPELKGDVELKIGKALVSLSHLDKVYYPKDGITKADVMKYYYEIAKYILPYLKDRPLIMKRYPNGIEAQFFHQHDVDEVPEYVRTVNLEVVEGHTVDYLVCENLPTLLYLSNIGAIERHPWHSRIRNLQRPDYVVLDLDPGADVEFSRICEVALNAKAVLDRLGLASYAKTSGARGMHIFVPVKPQYSYDQIASFAEQVAKLIVNENPDKATVERSLVKRKRGQIYVDHMQNARGKSIVAPYSVRPKPGAPVSAPLEWSEVKRKKITPQDFTIENMLERIETVGDLFSDVLKNRQRLEPALAEIERAQEQKKAKRARA
jgi:bifunctional non-homologous end joining protein LigD